MKYLILPYISFFCGVILEGLRLSNDIKKFLKSIGIALFGSLFIFFPSFKNNHYNLENRLENWPWFFLAFLIVSIALFQKDRIRPRLNEGMTLIANLNFLYFFLVILNSTKLSSWTWILLLPTLTLISAFSHWGGGRRERLLLSVWNTCIYAVFGVYSVIYLFLLTQRYLSVVQPSSNDTIYYSIEFAMMGGASIYIFYNLYMIVGFLPSKRRFFNDEYFKDVRQLVSEHIDRYSPVQIHPLQSLVICLLQGGPLLANYYFKFTRPSTLLWFSLSISPLVVLALSDLIFRKKEETMLKV